MVQRLACYTLFNITSTGVVNRSRPDPANVQKWVHDRNTQCNYDTVLQVISLRSQPEIVKSPTRIEVPADKFGFLYQFDDNMTCWKFEFEVQHPSVFENGIIPLGALYKDCEGVPMILCEDQVDTPPFLNISEELRNIYFEAL